MSSHMFKVSIHSERKKTVVASIARVGNDDSSQIYFVISSLKCAQLVLIFPQALVFHAWFASHPY